MFDLNLLRAIEGPRQNCAGVAHQDWRKHQVHSRRGREGSLCHGGERLASSGTERPDNGRVQVCSTTWAVAGMRRLSTGSFTRTSFL
jgi:hypothetical protein